MAANGTKSTRRNEFSIDQIRDFMRQAPSAQETPAIQQQPSQFTAEQIRGFIKQAPAPQQVATVAPSADQPLIAPPPGMTAAEAQLGAGQQLERDILSERQRMAQERGLDLATLSPQEQEAFVPDPSLRMRFGEAITGERRRTPETETLPRLSKLSGDPDAILPSFSDVRRAGGILFASSPEERVKIIKAAIPGMTFRFDEKGNIIGKFPDGREGVLNKPGFSFNDALKITSEVGKFLPATSAAGLGATALSRLGLGIGASTLTAAAGETASAALGGEFEPSEIAIEAGSAFLGSLPDAFRVAKTNIIKPLASRRSEKSLSKKLGEESVDPEFLDEIRRGTEEFDEAARALKAEGLATFAERAGVPDLLDRQLMLQMVPATRRQTLRSLGERNPGIENIAREFIQNFSPIEVLGDGALRFQMGARKAIKNEIGKIQQQAKPLYDRARRMNPDVDLQEPRQLIQDFLRTQPQEGKVGEVAQELKKAFEFIRGTQTATPGFRKKPTFAQLDNAKKLLDDIIHEVEPGKTVSNQASGALTKVRNSLRDQLDLATRTNPDDPASSIYKQARNIYSEELPSVIGIRDGVVGQIARMKDANFKDMSSRLFQQASKDPREFTLIRNIMEEASPGSMDDMIAIELNRRMGGLKTEGRVRVQNIAEQIRNQLFPNNAALKAFQRSASDEGAKNLKHFNLWLSRIAEGLPPTPKGASASQLEKNLSEGLLSKFGKGGLGAAKVATLGQIQTGVGGEVLKGLTQRQINRNALALSKVLLSKEYELPLSKLRNINPRTASGADQISRTLGQLVDEAAETIDEEVLDSLEQSQPTEETQAQ